MAGVGNPPPSGDLSCPGPLLTGLAWPTAGPYSEETRIVLWVGPGEADLAPGAAREWDCNQGRGSEAGLHRPSPVAFREDLRDWI